MRRVLPLRAAFTNYSHIGWCARQYYPTNPIAGFAHHELPTADCIGPIVFDSGPKTQAEFDIVIQAYFGEPQRISRQYVKIYVLGRLNNLMLPTMPDVNIIQICCRC